MRAKPRGRLLWRHLAVRGERAFCNARLHRLPAPLLTTAVAGPADLLPRLLLGYVDGVAATAPRSPSLHMMYECMPLVEDIIDGWQPKHGGDHLTILRR